MKNSTALILMALCAMTFSGCGGGVEDASVKGLPALKADPNDDSKPMSAGMSMPGDQMMMMRLDKNRDGEISPDEFPDGGLDGYDLDGDGTVTAEEMKIRSEKIGKIGLSGIAEERRKQEQGSKDNKPAEKKPAEKSEQQ